MFTIHSIGDSAFLEQILVAVSMFTGTGDFEKMVSIGLLLGVLIICIQSVFQGAKQINFQQVLLGWVIYACSFGPTTTVAIEDAYTGEVRVVANVPLLVGFAGGMISNVGYTITNLFETGYGVIVPNVTESHFSETLKLLNDVRRRAYDTGIFTALNVANGGGYVDVRLSWNNYIRECTLTKVDLKLMSLDELMNSPTETALRFNSQLYGTRLYLSTSTPDGADYTCTDGWFAISGATDNLNSPVVVNALNNLLDIDTSTGNNSITKLTDSLQAMGATTTSSIDYLKAAVLEPLYYEAASGRYQDLQDYGSALMINQAIQQRNTQWAAEQSMFMTVVRPMLTFFEGFIYAITPIIAFIIVMGSFGLQLAGKYVQTILWIQLWMPVLSIINLFVHTAASKEMSSLSSAGLDSMYALSSTGDVLQHWIATGGMLAAATPIISLFIITGSTYAFTSLASRINGGDHVNEKIQTPDLLQQEPVMKGQPAFSYNQFSGAMASGAESLVDKVNIGQTLSSVVSSSQAASAQATRNFSEQLSNSVFSGASAEQSFTRLQGLGQTLRASDSTQAKAIYGQAQDYARQFGLSETHTDAIAGAIAMKASGSVDAGKLAAVIGGPIGRIAAASGTVGKDAPLKVQGDVSGSAESRTTDQRQQLTTDLDKLAKNLGFSKDDSAALTQDLARQTNTESGQRFTNSLGEEQREQLSQSATQAVSAQNTYQRLSAAQSSIGTASQMDMRALAASTVGSPAASTMLQNGMRMASTETRQAAAEKARFYQALGMDSAQALAGGQIYALLNSGKGAEQAVAAEAISAATGGVVTQEVGRFNENQLLFQQAPGITSLNNTQKLQDPSRMTEVQRTQADSHMSGDEAVFQQHDKNMSRVQDAHVNQRDSFQEERLGSLRTQIMNSNITPSTASNVFATSEGAGRFWGQVVGGTSGAVNGFSSDFADSMNQLAHMSPEQRDQFIEDARRGDEYIQENYGLSGYVATGAADLGRNIIGAGVSGYYAAKEWLSGSSDLSEAAQGMSIRERGAFFAAALSSAAEAGAEQAETFVRQYGDEFHHLAVQTAKQEHGLHSEAAAQLFASSILGASDGNEEVYREQLRQEMGDDDLANKTAEIIEASAGAGREQAGGYLIPVSRYFAVKQGGGS
ncbi:conjugal transfer protein TraG N-terminal domain-containing protein [Photobacterium sp. TLY01]|uniref:conjugal transfer protein TraG N-terminal domain-containing protein n=1 Tax=Photobacterium sp. TLY01 TaxID=2907534 RepID=UPI001F1C9F8D|nr:conjugal transfer protein TraG N-terminal domain-containing protein [Photobacterium sp. TLY01]UIP27679.1 conjugal transfer protein TraG N-terminal domain-containing protein [Photobacterium sp. TLY01]